MKEIPIKDDAEPTIDLDAPTEETPKEKETPAAKPPSLEEQIDKLTAALAQSQDKLIRTMAEWDNSRKRMAKEKEDAIRFANEGLLESLLPIIDNFELGMQAAANAGPDAKAITVGLQMVLSQLQNFLRDSGLEAIDAIGKPFDPHKHEALGHQPSDKPEGTVLSQNRKGYLLKGKLLRPAMVFVSEGEKEKGSRSAGSKSESDK